MHALLDADRLAATMHGVDPRLTVTSAAQVLTALRGLGWEVVPITPALAPNSRRLSSAERTAKALERIADRLEPKTPAPLGD